MDGHGEILNREKETAKKRVLFLPHAIRQISRPERMITAPEVRKVINMER
jgi:hypothetical protein